MKFSNCFFLLITGVLLLSIAKGDKPASQKQSATASKNAKAAVKKSEKKPEPPSPLLAPAEALKTFTVPSDVLLETVLAEPQIRQPLFINWDERGRMWVVQYIQYPYPAGLKMLSRDKYWRAVYDKIPQPPPNHVRGKDKITIHEDTNGDGRYDSHKTFLEGQNIVTSCAKGRGGVWVLNPPYLLFYPDRNNDDIPDGDPVVHLQGFGMEDTHSVVNSLRFGPDGWLYAAQGSTVSGNVIRPKLDKHPVRSMGQLIWRYHPETKRYEIFAEGGGNAFGVEIDRKGRIYSGHNGGNTRGFHYVQGGYYRKGFQKHGPLSNPYSFGYFEPMAHHNVPRFTHNFVIYEGGALPESYRGRLFGVEPLQGTIVMSDIKPDRSSFKTKDLSRPIATTDLRFRPVEIKTGPDGAIYVADWYEPQISHREHFAGNIDKNNGRIYRLRRKGARPLQPFNLGAMTSAELIDVLGHKNKWYRQTALRLLGDRKDASVVPMLTKRFSRANGQTALEYLWAINLCTGFDDAFALTALDHREPWVRHWAVRLLCDKKTVSTDIAGKLANMAGTESSVHVRSQLASSARRLPAKMSLPIVANLLARDEDINDIHIPLLLWWALEVKANSDRDKVLALFQNKNFWKRPLVEKHILHRMMQRYATAGSRKDLLSCAALFELSPGERYNKLLMTGFEQAFKGRTLAGLPDELNAALAKAGGGSLALGVRQGKPKAVQQALAAVANKKTDKLKRLEYAQVFGEVDKPECISVLLDVFARSADNRLRMACLTALKRYSELRIARRVIETYAQLPAEVRDVAHTLLVGRKEWNRLFLEAVDAGRIKAKTIPLDVVRKMTVHNSPRISTLVKKHWKNVEGASTAAMQKEIATVSNILKAGSGDPYRGKTLYTKSCGKCHLLFGEGGRIGPDLTTFKRDDVLQILINIVNPSAEIREGFENYLVATDDGLIISGFLYDQDNRVVVIRGADGQNVTLPRNRIDEMARQKKSLMPEGLLKDLSEQQVRDLFAYLRISQPLNN